MHEVKASGVYISGSVTEQCPARCILLLWLKPKKEIVEQLVGMKCETVVFRSHIHILTAQETKFAFGVVFH
jgi:hypothetical protein